MILCYNNSLNRSCQAERSIIREQPCSHQDDHRAARSLSMHNVDEQREVMVI